MSSWLIRYKTLILVVLCVLLLINTYTNSDFKYLYTTVPDRILRKEGLIKDLETVKNAVNLIERKVGSLTNRNAVIPVSVRSDSAAMFNNSVKPSTLLSKQTSSIVTFVEKKLPHLKKIPDWHLPITIIKSPRKNVSLLFAIPTVKRPKDSYIEATLTALIGNLSPRDRQQCLILVMITELENKEYKDTVTSMIKTKFSEHITSGLIEVSVPHPKYFPQNWSSVTKTLGDSINRIKWRAKEILDVAFIMLNAVNRCKYYMHLEDDIQSRPEVYPKIIDFINTRNDPWTFLEFSKDGSRATLFRSEELENVIHFFFMFHYSQPIDWLIYAMLKVELCGLSWEDKKCKAEMGKRAPRINPHLFYHAGRVSSLSENALRVV